MIVLYVIALLLILSPIVYFASLTPRRIIMWGATAVLLYFAYIIAAGFIPEDVSLSLDFAVVGINSFNFTSHPYGLIAGFAFALVSAFGFMYGVRVANPSEQAGALIAVASALGVSFAADFVTFYLFWEMLTFSVGVIVLLAKTRDALRAGLRFLVFQVTGGLMLLFGILLNYWETGSLLVGEPVAGVPLFVLGIGIKSAFIIAYFWLPWAYTTANFPSSVVLAALSTKAAVYALSRVVSFNEIVLYIGVAMTIFGFTMALAQKNLRKLLAYHIISQVGYMVAGVGLASTQGVDGALLHLLNHMLYKGLLFMAAGSVLFSTGTESVLELKGSPDKPYIWKLIPIPVVAGVCGALAISGMPFFNGFVSKYILKYAFADVQPAGALLMVASVGTALSFCKFLYFGFFKARAEIIRRPTFSMNVAMIVVSLATIILGVRAELIEPLLPHASSLPYYSLANIWGGFQFILYGIIVFIILRNFLDPANKPVLFQKLVFVDPFWDWFGSVTFVLAKAATAFDRYLNIIYEGGSTGLKRILSLEFLQVGKEKAYEMALQAGKLEETLRGDFKKVEKKKKEPREDLKIFDIKGWNIKNLNVDAMIMALLLTIFLLTFFYYFRT